MSKSELQSLAAKIKRMGGQAGPRVLVERSALSEIENRWDLDDKAKSRGKAREWERIQKDALAFQVEYQRARREFDALAAKMTNPHKLGGGVEGELLRQAAWRRLERVLDNSKALVKFPVAMKALEDAAAQGDVHMIDAARRELGPWLAIQGEKLPDEMVTWMDINGSSTEAADARLVLMDAEEAFQRADMAVGAYTVNAAKQKFPDVVVGMTPGEVIYTDPDRDPDAR